MTFLPRHELSRIKGRTRRIDGYNYFSEKTSLYSRMVQRAYLVEKEVEVGTGPATQFQSSSAILPCPIPRELRSWAL
jgi:hypothetical protein